MKNIFEFSDYKLYLTEIEQHRKGLEKGFRSKLAAFIGCQSGYISHVLNDDAQFSLEQAFKVASFLKFTEKERKYFLLLVEKSRAGTPELQKYFNSELSLLREEHFNIKEHVGESRILSEVDQATYYSSWQYLAVHVLSSMKDYNDSKSIAHALRLPEDVVGRVLLFLIEAGIVSQSNGRLEAGLTQVHLNRESPLIRQHHTNWRIAAIQSLMNNNPASLHYSTVSTLSKADVEKLRAEMVKLIESYVKTVKPSPEEVMVGFNLDFYELA